VIIPCPGSCETGEVRRAAPIATRVSELLGQMTLDDKLAMVDGVGGGSGSNGYPGQIAANPGLCIPELNLDGGPGGVSNGGTGATQLPAPVALVIIGGKQVFASQFGVGSVDRASVTLPAGETSIEVDYADTILGFDDITLGWSPPADLLGQAVAAAKSADVAVVFASNAWWNNGWTVTPGQYALMVGDSSAGLPLVTHVEVAS
jgi:hypothetical protein